jgi:sugar O-acyltransferase (sialic acid O-acetyltransferase NeuD family)
VNRLFIIGAGGHGAVVAEAAEESGLWSEILFLDDGISTDSVLDFPIAGRVDQLGELVNEDTSVIVAIGDGRKRESLCRETSGKGIHLATVIHPNTCISPSATLSPGTVVCAGVIVNARAKIGRACILNTAATIDHDCVIEDGAHISPGANLAGNVTVGECAWVGIGSAIKEGIHIGSDSVIGAGSAVVADVGSGETVGGVPARRLHKR